MLCGQFSEDAVNRMLYCAYAVQVVIFVKDGMYRIHLQASVDGKDNLPRTYYPEARSEI